MVRQSEFTSAVNTRDQDLGGTWSFDISATPLSREEQAVFSADLERLGSTQSVWDVYATTLSISSRYTKSKVLRASNDGQLAGVVFFMECRKSGECFFEPPLSTLIDLPKLPAFIWSRYGTGTDHNANPGFVAEGIDRHALKTQAIRELSSRYMQGSVVDFVDDEPVPGAVRSVGFDSGFIDVTQFSTVDDYIGRRRKLRSKLNAFRNKGGTIEMVRGAVSADLCEAFASIYDTMPFKLLTPYQDIFNDLVRNASAIDRPNIVHLIARADNDLLGYHSFIVGDGTLHCLSGGFDRSRKTTWNAYDNMLVESVRLALDLGLRVIEYGPVLNDTKAKMMTNFATMESRTYVRYGFMKRPLAALMRRSALESERVKRYRGLTADGSPAVADG